MVLAIFAYIDHLFTKIKPQKVFFMAIDGVAPRAKMNQQRSRRFRTAQATKEMRAETERKGEKLPDEKAFDSNCITPGTPFMARLSAHLKYFVNKRISEDAEWRNVKVILSGHDVPGEGEHKIQEFIRLSKAQPDYNPNTRHCLYGLDADLIMLGLLSHDPHFCLLREEVTFGRKTKKNTGLSQTNFFLLHLSLLREYLDLEFSPVASQISFEYNLERIIDDFILMAVFVGNDFLPHLPDLHINEGAMDRIWGIYKEVLPQAGGYLNEHGTISLPRLQLLLNELGKFEEENFEKEFADDNWYKGKQTKEIAAMEKAKKRGKMIITKEQQKLLVDIKKFVTKHLTKPTTSDRCVLVNNFSARDQRFVQELADSLHLHLTWDEVDEYGQKLAILTFDMEGVSEDGVEEQEDGEEEWEEENDGEGEMAIKRVFDKYSKAKVVENTVDDFEDHYEESIKQKMVEWKKRYYKEKLEINYDVPEEIGALVFRYVEGLQWILNYYYKGVSSWGWFYDYHYSPRITDLQNIDHFKFDFDYGKPFTPFQQLMGVLPEESKDHVPAAYRDLMYEETSPILDFYPQEFELDMNGKKQEWEAVVKVPFIDQARLLRAMAARDVRLTPEEKERNKSGVLSTQFEFDEAQDQTVASSLPGFFPDLVKCRCKAQPFHLPTLGGGIDLILGLLDGVHLGASALAGFPSMETLPHQGSLGYHGVSVFQSDSKNQSMVITITGKHDRINTGDVAKNLIGQRTFHSWPFLQEGMVMAVSDDTFKYESQQMGKSSKVVANPHNPFQAIAWKRQADNIEHHHSKRYGIITGNVDVILHVRPLKGLKRLDTGALIKDYEGPEKEISQALQLNVHQVTFEDERFLEQAAPPLAKEFPAGEKVIFLGHMAYGTAAQVVATTEKTLDIGLAYFPSEVHENKEFTRVVAHRPSGMYYPSFQLARRIGVSSLALSRITSTLMVLLGNGQKVNIGLSLKFESKGLKVLGYSRKNDRGWEFSELTAQVLTKYRAAFPVPFNNFDSRGGDMVTPAELCPTSENPELVIKEMHRWLKTENVSELEPVSLFAEQLEKESVAIIEKVADNFRANKTSEGIKRALVKGIPRQALLKPSHAIYRLQGQKFVLGDRVIMVQDAAAGGVPLAMKGVVIGLGSRDIDVVWDVPFMGGETLAGRCSNYRGSTVPFTSCLNLTTPQFSVGYDAPPSAIGTKQPFKPQLGPQPVLASNHYRPAVPGKNPVQILANPNRQPPPRQTGYGNAVRGIRPPPVHPQANGHAASLQTALLGNGTRGAHHPHPVPHPHGHPLPIVAGRGAAPPRGRGTARGRGGGGGGRGKGVPTVVQ
ncbi:5'-3' exoribonuclease 1, partial [Tremellales sp. Uapishka_1]